MLEDIPKNVSEHGVFRYDAMADYSSVLSDFGLDEESKQEMLQLVKDRRLEDSPEARCDSRFSNPNNGRFSDGSFSVYYIRRLILIPPNRKFVTIA